MSHGELVKHPRNPIYHFLFIPDPPKHISTFSEKLLVLLRIKAKGKARLGVVGLFFSHIILLPFLKNKSMHELYFHPYLAFPLEL